MVSGCAIPPMLESMMNAAVIQKAAAARTVRVIVFIVWFLCSRCFVLLTVLILGEECEGSVNVREIMAAGENKYVSGLIK